MGIDQTGIVSLPQFNHDASLFAWGNPDGTVMVCHLPEIQRRLAPLDLGW